MVERFKIADEVPLMDGVSFCFMRQSGNDAHLRTKVSSPNYHIAVIRIDTNSIVYLKKSYTI